MTGRAATTRGPVERVTVGGHALRVRRHPGPGTPAPTLLLTAAWPQTLRCWDLHWEALAARHPLVAVELPGFGLSGGDRAVMRPGAQAAVLQALVGLLGLGRVVVVAPDVGVPVSLALAQRAPEVVAGLVLFAGPSSYPPALSWEGRLLTRSAVARGIVAFLGVPFTLESMRRGYRRFRPPRRAVLEYVRSAASPRRFGRQLAFVGSYAEELPRIEAGLSRIEAPALVLWGEEDVFVLPENGVRLAERLPRATWRPLPGCGHYTHEDAGDAFVAELDRWERSVAAALASPAPAAPRTAA